MATGEFTNGTELSAVSSAPSGLGALFEDIDASDLGQGLCSTRVQGVIHLVHGNSDEERRSVQIGNPLSGHSEPGEVFEVAESLTWKLLAAETGEEGEVQQTIYFAKANLAGQWEAVPVFLMLEKANEQDCSVALCLPAADATDLEWGVVCTKADEGRPVTVDESLKDIPQTNAEVLDTLISVLTGKKYIDHSQLLDVLHVNELHQRAFPKTGSLGSLEFAKPSYESQQTLLAKRLRALGEWAVLGAANTSASSDPKAGNGIGSHALRFTPLDPERTEVARVTSGLGTKDKVRILGHIVPRMEVDSLPIPNFLPDPELAQLVDDATTADILNHAAKTYDIKEVITIPELTQSINSMIANILATVPRERHAGEFNERLQILFERYKKILHDKPHSATLDIGEVDISQLTDGAYFDCLSLIHPLSAKVQANKLQSVFKIIHTNRLKNCQVDGAKSAFEHIEGSGLIARNCDTAFINCDVTESIAENIRDAFIGGDATNCIAQNCIVAFSGLEANSSAAVYCSSAFVGLHSRSKNLVAELCGKAFIRRDETALPRETQKQRNYIKVNSTRRSVVNSYRAARRFGKKPATPITEDKE